MQRPALGNAIQHRSPALARVTAGDEGPRGSEALRRKMAATIANAARLGWLLFPEQRAAELEEIWAC